MTMLYCCDRCGRHNLDSPEIASLEIAGAGQNFSGHLCGECCVDFHGWITPPPIQGLTDEGKIPILGHVRYEGRAKVENPDDEQPRDSAG